MSGGDDPNGSYSRPAGHYPHEVSGGQLQRLSGPRSILRPRALTSRDLTPVAGLADSLPVQQSSHALVGCYGVPLNGAQADPIAVSERMLWYARPEARD
jgi:hypothetical protein